MTSPKYPTRQLGANGPYVSAIGLGAMGIGAYYGETDYDETFKMLTYACDNGVTFWDTADIYGSSEETLGKWFASTGRRSEIFLASKFGASGMRDESERPEAPNENGIPPPNSKPSYILRQLQRSLSLLQTDHIDLYYQHRPDPHVPVEVVLETLRPAFEDGRIRWFGISECSVDVVRRAKAVKGLGEKFICVQMEYGPFELVHERSGLLAEVEKLGVGVVAYSPLGRGLITGKFRSRADFEKGDLRLLLPRFDEANFPANVRLADQMKNLATKYNATSAQLALAWILAEHPGYIPIPGSRTIERLRENMESANLATKLSPEDIREIRDWVDKADVQGSRYPSFFQRSNECGKLEDWRGE
ncbi:Aldo/keto reductase [Stereum hirsutum FP-91666 SS1]|uniref:Aldo/keto reductase n=1 Tax=Stereum hirsutum (strain FP-91666) TaxID=721885 RepID=UPI0004409FC7|nr:Aldo/keto reductase [Stereum hirsutum FP-91666 SS1]EIM88900.1 Aldo/keto reductase [Stereum hirsutum FP-91666 SS1]